MEARWLHSRDLEVSAAHAEAKWVRLSNLEVPTVPTVIRGLHARALSNIAQSVQGAKSIA